MKTVRMRGNLPSRTILTFDCFFLFFSGNSELLLKASSTHIEILEAMRNLNTGVGFLTQNQSLRNNTFISADAVAWLINHVENVSDTEQAMQILIGMNREQLICHASGDFHRPFLYGFYLYYIVSLDKGK